MWDNPAKLGQPTHRTSQAALGRTSGVGQLASKWDDHSWDTPAELGRPMRVVCPNRLGCPMQMWDDSVVDHPTTSLGHTTQAGTSHTNWADPIFPRLLSGGVLVGG